MGRSLEDKVIVITGASSGIGRATALKCAAEGATVLLVARSEPALNEVAEQIRLDGGQAHVLVGDVTDAEQMNSVAQQTVIAFGRIDVWVNNAAVALYGMVSDVPPKDFAHVLHVNLLGTYHGVQAVLPYLQQQRKGAIINIGSVLSVRAVPLQAAYCAAKFGVRGFTDALRMELMSQYPDIHVTLVLPSSINTPFFDHARSLMGVRPQPVPPAYPVETAAEVIVEAIKTHPREVFVGGAGIVFSVLQKLSPELLDRLMVARKLIFRLQKTKTADDGKDAFEAPLEGSYRLSGSFDHMTKPSLYAKVRRAVPFFVPVSVLLAAALSFSLYKKQQRDSP